MHVGSCIVNADGMIWFKLLLSFVDFVGFDFDFGR